MELIILGSLLGLGAIFSLGGGDSNEEDIETAPDESEEGDVEYIELPSDGEENDENVDVTPDEEDEEYEYADQSPQIIQGIEEGYVSVDEYGYVISIDYTGDVLLLPNNGTTVTLDPDGNDTVATVIYDDGVESEDMGGPIPLTDGDDYGDFIMSNGSVDGQMGNDTINLYDSYYSSASGGEGDDLLKSGGWNGLRGGEGNDTLIGSDYWDHLYGGPGDDVIEVSVEGNSRYMAGIGGGEGNDTIRIIDDISFDGPGNGKIAEISGDEGADLFDVRLNLSDDPYPNTSGSSEFNLYNFDPTEDSLVIQINREEGNLDREMTSAEIVTTETTLSQTGEIITHTNIVLEFAATDTVSAQRLSIPIHTDQDFSIDDITFVQN